MEVTPKIKLTLPRQDLAEFTLFRPNAEGASAWARSLPVADPLAVAELKARALAELNRVPLQAEERYDVLEALRPTLESMLAALSKRYLNQPLVMEQEPRQMAALADRVHALTTTAYTIVATQTILEQESIKLTNPARLACQALQRALHFAGGRVLRSYQLYRPLEMYGWRALHQLYSLAESQELDRLAVPEPALGSSTIKGAYLRSLLLGCCKPNKLSPRDLAHIYDALRDWAELVELTDSQADDGLFVVDLNSDQPPRYATGDNRRDDMVLRTVKTERLILRLEQLIAAGEARQRELEALPAYLLDHLVESLGTMSQRNFTRNPGSGHLRVCVGLSSIHYHVAGRKAFKNLLLGNEYTSPGDLQSGHRYGPSEERSQTQERVLLHDEWLHDETEVGDLDYLINIGEDDRAGILEEVEIDLPLDQRYPIYKVPVVDASPGGYRLQWEDELPAGVKTGDIVGLKEEYSMNWAIAVIRWFSRRDSDRALMGLELLCPRAVAFGALAHRKNGSKAPPMRALLLPEITLVGQPQTLLVPRSRFNERQRVSLVRGPKTDTVQLLRQIGATANYTQFEFRYITELGDVLSRSQPGRLGYPYDSVWSRI